jgi:hypothetical protein
VGELVSLRSYEGTVFNRLVRHCLENDEENLTGLDDAWADSRLIEVRARSIGEATALLDRDYPASAGFVIIAVVELPD